jgi:hypothetical protein
MSAGAAICLEQHVCPYQRQPFHPAETPASAACKTLAQSLKQASPRLVSRRLVFVQGGRAPLAVDALAIRAKAGVCEAALST